MTNEANAAQTAQVTEITYAPLTTTREERGRQIAERGGIRQIGAKYVVPSQTIGSESPTYIVDLVEETCTCPDYELRRLRCKHQEAVWFWLAWEGAVRPPENATEGEEKTPRRKSYPQDWRAYNAAQTSEKDRVQTLLKSLVEGIEEPPSEAGAR
jgi:hypothetical protein